MNIGNRIIQLREEQNISQLELSKKININNSVLSRIESGKRPARDDELIALSNFFNVSVDYLLGKSSTRELTQEEENDVYKKFEDLKNSLENTDDLMFCGEILDDETRELLLSSLKNTILTSKIIAKEREKNK